MEECFGSHMESIEGTRIHPLEWNNAASETTSQLSRTLPGRNRLNLEIKNLLKVVGVAQPAALHMAAREESVQQCPGGGNTLRGVSMP